MNTLRYIKTLMNRSSLLISIILIALIGSIAIMSPSTFTPTSILNIARQGVPLALASFGQTTVMLTSGADLSIGAIITLTNILASDLMRGRNAVLLPIAVLCLFTGAIIGLINGIIIANTGVPPMVMTLGTAWVIQGMYMVYSQGAPVGRIPPILRYIGSGNFIGFLPVSIVFLIPAAIVFIVLLNKTTFGWKLFYTGSNRRASFLSGIKAKRMTVYAYVFSGLMASLAGLVLSGYIGIGTFQVGGLSTTLNSFASSVLGGTTFAGGEGGFLGTAIGAMVIKFLNAFLISLGLGEPGKLITRGIIMISMIALYAKRN